MMCMYTKQEVLRWIDAELDTEAHNEILVLGDAEVEGWVKQHDNLLQKKKKGAPHHPTSIKEKEIIQT